VPEAAIPSADPVAAEAPARPLTITGAGEALRRFHDATSPLSAVRVVDRSIADEDDDSGGLLTDFDPW